MKFSFADDARAALPIVKLSDSYTIRELHYPHNIVPDLPVGVEWLIQEIRRIAARIWRLTGTGP